MKQMTKVKGALRDMKGKKSVGVVEHDQEKGIMKIAKPMNFDSALMPFQSRKLSQNVWNTGMMKRTSMIRVIGSNNRIPVRTLFLSKPRSFLLFLRNRIQAPSRE